jgi:lipoate-protein ligase B
MSHPPILVRYLKRPLPYVSTLALQERLHNVQLSWRRQGRPVHDLLLLLQHRPVYTAGRRQTESELGPERSRLTHIGADFVSTQRGGQLTYHGPGQLVGYPLLDLGRTKPPIGIRDYICHIQTAIKAHLRERHSIKVGESEHTGVFLDANTKVASIGVQVRHRLTTHGFALNINNEPRAWFNQIVACGLADVRAGSVQGALGQHEELDMEVEARALVNTLVKQLGREMLWTDLREDLPSDLEEVSRAVQEVEEEAESMEPYARAPKTTGTSFEHSCATSLSFDAWYSMILVTVSISHSHPLIHDIPRSRSHRCVLASVLSSINYTYSLSYTLKYTAIPANLGVGRYLADKSCRYHDPGPHMPELHNESER